MAQYPKDSHLHTSRRENLKSQLLLVSLFIGFPLVFSFLSALEPVSHKAEATHYQAYPIDRRGLRSMQ
jgi:hypothetical protein